MGPRRPELISSPVGHTLQRPEHPRGRQNRPTLLRRRIEVGTKECLPGGVCRSKGLQKGVVVRLWPALLRQPHVTRSSQHRPPADACQLLELQSKAPRVEAIPFLASSWLSAPRFPDTPQQLRVNCLACIRQTANAWLRNT